MSLAGRDRELAAVGVLLDRAAAGTGGVLTIYGPSGAGKTALAEAAAEEGRRRGFAIGRAVAAAIGPARMAWAQLIRQTGGPAAVASRLLEEATPVALEEAAEALVSLTPRLIVVDDLDRGHQGALEFLPVLAGRVGGSFTAVIVTASAPLDTGQEMRLGPLGEEDLGAAVGESRPEVRRALWLASGGLPGPALSLTGRLAGLDPGADPVVHLALSAPSQLVFLAIDPPLIRLHALWDPAAAEDRLAASSEIIDLARAAGDDVHERHGMFWRFVALMELGRVAEAGSALAAFERAAQVAGDDVVTTFVGAGIMSTERPLPMNRIYLLNPGQSLDAGDRRLTGFRPPLFDNPATVGILDTSTGTCLSSDCFGAPLPTAELATAHDTAAVSPGDLRAAQLLWATVDSPWVHAIDPAKYAASFGPLRDFGPSAILSTHLPPVTSDPAALFATLLDAPHASPFTGPDQAALEAMLREFQPA